MTCDLDSLSDDTSDVVAKHDSGPSELSEDSFDFVSLCEYVEKVMGEQRTSLQHRIAYQCVVEAECFCEYLINQKLFLSGYHQSLANLMEQVSFCHLYSFYVYVYICVNRYRQTAFTSYYLLCYYLLFTIYFGLRPVSYISWAAPW